MKNKIELKNLFINLNDKDVLDDFSLDILDGETFVLIGQSGVGKSVLLKHIIGLMEPDSGEVYIDGELLDYYDETKLDKIRRKFGMLFQGGALFDSLTVGENILFALDHQRDELEDEVKFQMVSNALNLVELPGTENLTISSLSGGMMKRVALARAIVSEPDIVLFDEPTTGLDPITTASINELISSIKKKLNTTFVVVTHDLVSARYISDRIGMIYKGKMIFIGTKEELDKTDNPYVKQFIKGDFLGPITDDYNMNLQKQMQNDINKIQHGGF